MFNKYLSSIILFKLFSFSGISQQLTIDETINYINQSIKKDEKLTLSGDGILVHSWTYLGKPYNKRGHISEIIPSKELESGNSWLVKLWCKGDPSRWRDPGWKEMALKEGNMVVSECCIQYNHDNSKTNVQSISLIAKEEDKYSSQKLLNAVNYLLTSAKESGLYERKDDDPFAPNNYISKGMEISSATKNGSIKLENNNGVNYLVVTIAGISKKFILDSGASDVLLSTDFETELLEKGVINKENYLPSALYRIANGDIVQCKRLIIPKLTIGSFTIKNVRASIGVGSVPLLLGKSVLDKFSKWTIDNITNTLIIEK